MLDGLKQLDKSVVVGRFAAGRLIHLNVTRISMYDLKRGTYSK